MVAEIEKISFFDKVINDLYKVEDLDFENLKKLVLKHAYERGIDVSWVSEFLFVGNENLILFLTVYFFLKDLSVAPGTLLYKENVDELKGYVDRFIDMIDGDVHFYDDKEAKRLFVKEFMEEFKRSLNSVNAKSEPVEKNTQEEKEKAGMARGNFIIPSWYPGMLI
ncbi:MAG: hypothetical protein N4A44_03680 [Alphaproteobacteria bacterium]|jgi:hypothetical protein|nr:hypothetical protein [Alphaproteobacteria bacterium]